MTLTKADLADLLFEQVGLNKREAKDMVEAFFEEVRTALETGDSVKNLSAQAATPKLAKKSPLPHVASLHSMLAKN
jgi:Bacterial DNA-binding protein